MTFVARALLKPNRMLGLAAVIGLSLMASACGGGSSGANVAQVDANGGAKNSDSSSGSSAGKPDATAYSACMRRNGGRPAHPTDVERAGVRYSTAGALRGAGFAVIHTCGRKGESNGHVSLVWPASSPFDEPDPAWPAHVQKAFAACFTEEG